MKSIWQRWTEISSPDSKPGDRTEQFGFSTENEQMHRGILHLAGGKTN